MGRPHTKHCLAVTAQTNVILEWMRARGHISIFINWTHKRTVNPITAALAIRQKRPHSRTTFHTDNTNNNDDTM